MKQLRDCLKSKTPSFVAWTDAGSLAICETLAQSGASTIVIDAQHGRPIEHKAEAIMASILKHGSRAMVRIPVGRYDMASMMLDLGAAGIIAPMINRAMDAQHFVEFVKYPPLGQRSYGPSYASTPYGVSNAQYVKQANDNLLAIAMIETREGVNNLEAILDVNGLDGILVGPSDLDISLTNSVPPNAFGDRSLGVIEDIAKEAKAKGKIAGIYCGNFEHSLLAKEMSYDFVCVGAQKDYMRDGLKRYMSIFEG